MSVDQLPTGNPRPAKRDAKFVRYDEYIDKQIQATRRMVKAVDVMTALLVMTTGALSFLLAAAIVEHWFVAGGFNVAVRLLLFVALVGGLSFYASRRLWPLCVGSINPAYAAQAIEQDNPSLKNSLLNLLLFRERREEITDAVYETLEEQAAQRLTRVPVDSAVDRTQLLRLGYVLIGIVAAVAFYKMFSPKDPFITAERVLMPWARIVPASRVSIENVEPGAVTLARGEVLTVSADVRGIGDDDPVVVRYTTADGQAVDRPAPMTPSAAGLRFSGQIPPAQDAAQGGVAQNLRYRIEAGDARSLEYSVTVVATPTITVERIDYDYPDYTGFANRSIERLGDIRAIEGTRVTIHARANQPIEEAAVDFEADGRRDVPFDVSSDDTRTTFLLELRDDRQTSKFTSYVLRFTSTDGRSNRDPVKFPIDVLPDYGPEVAILAPAEKVRDVRLDETVAIEVDASDPDFALAEVRLHGDSAGRAVFDEPLLTQEHTGRFTGRHLFTPSERNLQAGDVVRYWLTARDNRAPQANEVTSDSQTLRIVAPDPRQPDQPPPDRIAQREKREPQDGGQSQEGQQQQGEGGKSGGESQPGESASADGQPGQSDQQNSAEQSGENSSGEQSQDQSGEPESGGTTSGEGQTSAGEQSGESGEPQQQPGGESSAGQNGTASDQDQSQQPSGGESSVEQSDANKSEGKPGTNGQGGSERENPNGGEPSNNAQPHPGAGGQAKPGDESSPVSPEGDNDGEAFERIQDFLKREGKLPKEGDSKPQPGESASADGNQSDSERSDGKPNQQSDAESNSGDQADPNAESQNKPAGTDARRGDSQEKTSESSDQSSESPPANGQETSSEGKSGAGDQPQDAQGSPEAQPNMKPGDKWQQKPSGDQQGNEQGEKQEPPSGGQGKRQNDSQGEQGGDRSGGGEEGAGQKSQRDGTGSAGQNQSADEGAGESSEQGAGDNSPSAGQVAPSKDRTGQSGSEEKGAGSAERNGAGDEKGGKPGGEDAPARSDGEPASAGGDKSQAPNQEPAQSPSEQPNNGSQDSNSSTTDGAGRVPNGTMQPTKTDGTAPEADAANLEYARKQTDLVLETLAEQMKRQKVDKRLLDQLGWTEADLQRFLARWQQLKAAAQDDSPSADAAQRELDDALRSLGLGRTQLQQAKVSDDANRNLRQGYRGAVPLEYQERLRAYNQGVSRARPIDE